MSTLKHDNKKIFIHVITKAKTVTKATYVTNKQEW
jgi:hypothetical protein